VRKLVVIAAILLLLPTLNAETVIKMGAMVTCGKVEEFAFSFPSAELKVEQSIWKKFSLGLGIRKESRWGYNGYYLSLYPMYKKQLSKKMFVATSLGVEYGIASSKYNHYSSTYNEIGDLIAHKWIYLTQNASIPKSELKKGDIGVIYPFGTASCGIKLWKGLVIESGLKGQILRFGVKSCKFEATDRTAYDVRSEKIWKIIPSAFIQLGYKF